MPAVNQSEGHALAGVLMSFNLSPKGVPEGLILQPPGRGLVQINFPPELAGGITEAVSVGDEVRATCAPFIDAHPDAHPVYELIELTAADGTVFVAEGIGEEHVRVSGTVVRLNYARRGEMNGGILDTGEFVHLRPHGAKAVGVRLGMRLEAEGEVRGGWSGHRVIEARSANGISLEKPKPPKGPEPRRKGRDASPQ